MQDRAQSYTSVAVFVLAIAGATLQAAGPKVVPPAVPANLVVPAGNKAYLISHAEGTQNYVCLPNGSAYGWTFFGPQATLFDDDGDQQITHYLSANPDENGLLRPTWQHSRDTSSVWAAPIPGASSTDPAYVAPGAIPWLKLQVVGRRYGPAAGDKLTYTTFIQRVNTDGGMAPAEGCSAATDVGRKAFVPYLADYVFYRP